MFLSVDIPKLPENTIKTAHQNSVGADFNISKPVIIAGWVYGRNVNANIKQIKIKN